MNLKEIKKVYGRVSKEKQVGELCCNCNYKNRRNNKTKYIDYFIHFY